jgi:hypothetical protein
VIRAAAVVCAVAVGGFVVMRSLPQPTHADRVGVGVLRVLETHRGGGSRMHIGGRSLVARCRDLAGGRSLISLSDGTRFVLRGARVRRWRASPLASDVTAPGVLRAAEADLAGSYRLYAHELTAQLERGERVGVARDGEAYALALDSSLPRAELVVNRETLRPVGARFRSRTLTAHASLRRPRPLQEAPTC